jgi:hypothetical protein
MPRRRPQRNPERCQIASRGSPARRWSRKLVVEPLELRIALAVDFGDAPLPYPVTLAENGARHEAVGPLLGVQRSAEVDGVHTTWEQGENADDDGVDFGELVTGLPVATLGAFVSNAPAGARLDAWIDFNRDGSWGGPGEQVADNLVVSEGLNYVDFSIPASAQAGVSYARVRLSTAGNLGVGGYAVDGEAEDYAVNIAPPRATLDYYGVGGSIGHATHGATSVYPIDVDRDGDLDVLGTSFGENVSWYENDGSENFTERRVDVGPGQPWSIAGGDFDGDGDVDIATSYYWYANDGAQNFTRHLLPLDAFYPDFMNVADVDVDGDLDILIGSDNVRWLENDGAGQFASHVIAPVANGVYDIEAVDMDRDGDLDIMAAQQFADTLAWYENDGAQNFTPRAVSTDADGVRSAVAADLDGDGDMDAAAALTAGNAFVWYENNGQQSFTRHLLSDEFFNPLTIAAGDLDGDGDIDLTGCIITFENVGNGFEETDASFGFARDIKFGDIDGDGDLDVVVAADVSFGWAQRAAPADFGDAPAPYGTRLSEGGAYHEALGPRLGLTRGSEVDGSPSPAAGGDADDDGVVVVGPLRAGMFEAAIDIQVTGVTGQQDGWVSGYFDFDRDGVWSTAERITGGFFFSDSTQRVTFAIPENVAPGIIYARFRISTDSFLEGGAYGYAVDGEVEDYAFTIAPAFPAERNFSSGRLLDDATTGTSNFVAADFDEDGDDDVATIDYNNIEWHENLGNGAFVPRPLMSVNQTTLDMIAANVDGVAGVDLVVFVNGRISVLPWQGAGFGPPTTISPLIANFGALGVGDVDDDGDLDILSSVVDTRKISWHERTGGGFIERPIATYNYSTDSVYAADIDGDSVEDVVAETNGILRWFKFTAGSTFVAHEIGSGIGGTRPTDLDGDGDMDLLVPGRGVDWLENDGAGNFQRHTISINRNDIYDVMAADFDEDGDMDVAAAVTKFSIGSIAWYENDGEENFYGRAVPSNGSVINRLHALDVDGDGDLDLAVARTSPRRVFWFENRLTGDYDDDFDVDGADFLLWQRGVGAGVLQGSGADGNGDGLIDARDLTEWRTRFGAAPAGGGAAAAWAAAPDEEPTLAMLTPLPPPPSSESTDPRRGGTARQSSEREQAQAGRHEPRHDKQMTRPAFDGDRSTRLNSSHCELARMPSPA